MYRTDIRQHLLKILSLTVALGCVCSSIGCRFIQDQRTAGAIPYSTQPIGGSAVNIKAQDLNRKGIAAFNIGRLIKAEEYFRSALEEDVGFGPAHNNLGHVYLTRHQLYLAAWEFEYASNLMPELVEPIINQGLAYETGEQIQRAVEIYRHAYERFPQNPNAITSLTRALIKQDADPYEIAGLLDELIMTDGRQEWVLWAKELRMTKYRIDCENCLDTLSSDTPEVDGGYSVESDLPKYLVPVDPHADEPDITEQPPAAQPAKTNVEFPEIFEFPELNTPQHELSVPSHLGELSNRFQLSSEVRQVGFGEEPSTLASPDRGYPSERPGGQKDGTLSFPSNHQRINFDSLAQEIQDSME